MTIQFWVDIAQIDASTGVILTFIFTARSFIRLGKTNQIKLAEKFYSDMQQLNVDLSNYQDLKPYDMVDSVKLNILSERFYKTLDWNAYLIKTGQLRDNDLINHFKSEYLDFYEKVYLKGPTTLTLDSERTSIGLGKRLEIGHLTSG